jgi:hypothetical protein
MLHSPQMPVEPAPPRLAPHYPASQASCKGRPVVEALYLALRHPQLINQYGVSDGAEDWTLAS